MPYTQCSQHSTLCNGKINSKSLQTSDSEQPLSETTEEQAVDDILSRMDRLRSLASMQRRKSRSCKRQQFSFCF